MLPLARASHPSAPRSTEVVASWPPTATTRAIRVRKPEGFQFRPTQFTFLGLMTAEGPDWRPMSLATSPTREHLEYGVRTSLSPFKRAFEHLAPGDPVWVRGPFGEFVLDGDHPAVLVAGGIGITPLKGMAEYAADAKLTIPVRLLYSNRTEREIAYRGELDELARMNPRFRVLYTLTRGPFDGWDGPTGRIDASLLSHGAEGLERPKYYVCGTPEFVREMTGLLVRSGVPEADLEYELFRGY